MYKIYALLRDERGGWKTDRIMKTAYRYALTSDDKRVSMADEIAKKLQIS